MQKLPESGIVIYSGYSELQTTHSNGDVDNIFRKRNKNIFQK
jgi:hypothetical protein